MAPPKGVYKYEAIIIDSNLDSRMRLKQATASVHHFGTVAQVGTIQDALHRLNTENRCDVAFISHRFDQQEIAGFIKDAKKTPQGQDTAYILVLKNKDQDSTVVASTVMIGADGLLFEPYSVDILVEITSLAARVKKERWQAREEAALRFLLKDVTAQIDLLAYLKGSGYEMGLTLKKFKDACSVLTTLEPEMKEIYYKLAVDVFEATPPSNKVYAKKKYVGASSRIKKQMEKKLLEELEKDKEASGGSTPPTTS